MINEATNILLEGKDLSFIEAREAFDEILSGLANDIQTTSFLTALKLKSANADEISAGILSSRETIQTPYLNINYTNSIENISIDTQNNYIDILLATDLICAANDLFVSRYSFDGKTNKSFDILSLMGVNIKKEATINIDYESLNFAYLYLSNQSPYAKYSENIRKILPFESILNITTKMLNPLKSKNLFLGIKNKNQIQTFANVALQLGNENSIILSGDDNFPFVSIEKETIIAEAWKNKVFTYTLTPDLLGFSCNNIKQLECDTEEQNADTLLEIMQGKLKNPMYDAIILNSALSLYISKKTDSVMDGVELAKKTIDSGLMYEKFLQIKKIYS